MTAGSPEYQRGYQDAYARAKQNLAEALRLARLSTHDDDEGATVLTERQVMNIFATTFGVYEADQEFGPDPEMDRLVGAIIADSHAVSTETAARSDRCGVMVNGKPCVRLTGHAERGSPGHDTRVQHYDGAEKMDGEFVLWRPDENGEYQQMGVIR